MLELKNISKFYRKGKKKILALQNINLKVQSGEFLTIIGPSGSGKSTLLLTIGGMLRPTEGKVYFDGKDIYGLSAEARAELRAKNIGFVFQMFHLIPYLSLIDNVLLPWATGIRSSDRDEIVKLLETFNLGDRIYHRPIELSVGEQQRVAVVRALVNRPKLILADEPTGNLDTDNSREILKYLRNFRDNGGTVILVSHSTLAKEYADRTLTIRNGKIMQ